MFTTEWECINQCPIFETIGTPKCCPHCGTNEVFPTSDDVTKYHRYDDRYENWSNE